MRGLLLGLVAGLPLGPASAAVADVSIRKSVRAGLAIGLGGALVDVVYCLAVAAGLGAVFRAFPSLKDTLLVAGGLVLVAFGAVVATRKHRDAKEGPQGVRPKRGGLLRWVLFGTAISALNPSLMVSWVVLAGTSLATLSYFQVGMAAIGVFLGVSVWFSMVAIASHRGRMRYGMRVMVIPRLVGLLLVCYGFLMVARVASALVLK